jgi:hypothetical protein
MVIGSLICILNRNSKGIEKMLKVTNSEPKEMLNFCDVGCRFKGEIHSTQFGGIFSTCLKMGGDIFIRPIKKENNIIIGEFVAIEGCGEKTEVFEALKFID